MKTSMFVWVLMLGSAAASATEMYSWIDANGVKHFSDSPPPATVKSKKFVVKGGVGANAGEVSEAPKEEAPKENGGNNGPALAAAAGYAPADIKRNCDIAHGNLSTLQSQQPKLDADGKPDEAAATDHQAQVDKANQQIKLFCMVK